MDPKSKRLIDANLNRAKEGIRVVEDVARYVWDNKKIYKELRLARHGLQKATESKYADLLSSRHTHTDVGRKIKEGKRSTVGAVAKANIKRAQEATRVLEEFGKIYFPSSFLKIKKIRYKLYQIEKGFLKELKR